ncbi:MAG: hypothetical protein M0023_03880 [Desulfobacteraceae bacterium]|nr:hypothetical protein [Desulfobacteraceae bacterium]
MSDSIKSSVENLIEAVKNNLKLANSVFRASTYLDLPNFTVRSDTGQWQG